MQCDAVYCSVLQRIAVCCSESGNEFVRHAEKYLGFIFSTYYHTQQHPATHCNALQCTAMIHLGCICSALKSQTKKYWVHLFGAEMKARK